MQLLEMKKRKEKKTEDEELGRHRQEDEIFSSKSKSIKSFDAAPACSVRDVPGGNCKVLHLVKI